MATKVDETIEETFVSFEDDTILFCFCCRGPIFIDISIADSTRAFCTMKCRLSFATKKVIQTMTKTEVEQSLFTIRTHKEETLTLRTVKTSTCKTKYLAISPKSPPISKNQNLRFIDMEPGGQHEAIEELPENVQVPMNIEDQRMDVTVMQLDDRNGLGEARQIMSTANPNVPNNFVQQEAGDSIGGPSNLEVEAILLAGGLPRYEDDSQQHQ